MKLHKTFALLMLSAVIGEGSVAKAQQVADTAQVNVAFGTQAKENILGGVSAVSVSDLLKKDYFRLMRKTMFLYKCLLKVRLKSVQSHFHGHIPTIA